MWSGFYDAHSEYKQSFSALQWQKINEFTFKALGENVLFFFLREKNLKSEDHDLMDISLCFLQCNNVPGLLQTHQKQRRKLRLESHLSCIDRIPWISWLSFLSWNTTYTLLWKLLFNYGCGIVVPEIQSSHESTIWIRSASHSGNEQYTILLDSQIPLPQNVNQSHWCIWCRRATSIAGLPDSVIQLRAVIFSNAYLVPPLELGHFHYLMPDPTGF